MHCLNKTINPNVLPMSARAQTPFLDQMVKPKQQEQGKLPWYHQYYENIQYCYMQFLLITTLYVMEPWERILVISIFLFILSLFTYSALVYIPFHFRHILQSTIPSLSAVLMP